MADKTYRLDFALSDGSTKSVEFVAPQGEKGPAGSDANVTAENIKNVLGYTPADAEAVSQLFSEIVVPEGVKTEASRVVDTVLTREGTRMLRFLAIADAHEKSDDEQITAGTKELGQAVGEVLRQIGVDFVAVLGDTTWGSSSSDNATVLAEGKSFNRLVTDSIRGETQIWTEGNHETGMLTAAQIHALIYSHNKGLVQDADHWIEGYGYMDFPYQKVRVICLNTNQATGSDVSGVSDAQLKWLAETALDMEGKADWGVLTMGHHPIGYNNVTLFKNCATVLEAFISGEELSFTTNSGTELTVDYSTRNCQYIGHFHGHAHTYTMLPIQKYVSSDVYEELDAWEICIPNACASRTDQYYSLEDTDYLKRYYVGGIDYKRPEVDGQRTAFSVVTVCLDEKMIYVDDYGIVPPIDREVPFEFAAQQTYTNQIPISTDADGNIYGGDYDGDSVNDGYKTDTYLSSGNDSTRTGVEAVGFIPIGIGSSQTAVGEQVIYLSGITATTADTNCRVVFYDADKAYIQTLNATQFSTGGNYNIPLVTTVDDGGNILSIDVTAITAYFDEHEGRSIAYFRLCAPNIDGNSIITVNEVIA